MVKLYELNGKNAKIKPRFGRLELPHPKSSSNGGECGTQVGCSAFTPRHLAVLLLRRPALSGGSGAQQARDLVLVFWANTRCASVSSRKSLLFEWNSHSTCSSTCNGWQNEYGNVVHRGVSPLCLCGEKTVVRTARTVKNKGKQFWGCPKYKNGHENGGCNFFKWCCVDGNDKSYTNLKWEEKHEYLSKGEEMGGVANMVIDLKNSVKVLEKLMKVFMIECIRELSLEGCGMLKKS
ncbi:hypothetical protein V8G54_011312 [Vigna mungo]|uniref:GRF-type domain-containing protein n=1 Tax=Vigna mungo TaxID=3915 RepID=A0AAQ3NRS8_VIGMU